MDLENTWYFSSEEKYIVFLIFRYSVDNPRYKKYAPHLRRSIFSLIYGKNLVWNAKNKVWNKVICSILTNFAAEIYFSSEEKYIFWE